MGGFLGALRLPEAKYGLRGVRIRFGPAGWECLDEGGLHRGKAYRRGSVGAKICQEKPISETGKGLRYSPTVTFRCVRSFQLPFRSARER